MCLCIERYGEKKDFADKLSVWEKKFVSVCLGRKNFATKSFIREKIVLPDVFVCFGRTSCVSMGSSRACVGRKAPTLSRSFVGHER